MLNIRKKVAEKIVKAAGAKAEANVGRSFPAMVYEVKVPRVLQKKSELCGKTVSEKN